MVVVISRRYAMATRVQAFFIGTGRCRHMTGSAEQNNRNPASVSPCPSICQPTGRPWQSGAKNDHNRLIAFGDTPYRYTISVHIYGHLYPKIWVRGLLVRNKDNLIFIFFYIIFILFFMLSCERTKKLCDWC